MKTFNQFWEENKESLESTLGSGEPMYSSREIAHAAWAYSALSMLESVNDAVTKTVLEHTRESAATATAIATERTDEVQ